MTNKSLDIGACGVNDRGGADPYLRWADASAFVDFDRHGANQIDLIVELKPGKSLLDLNKLLTKKDRVARVYGKQPSIPYVTGLFTAATVKKFAANPQVVNRFDLANTMLAPRSPRRKIRKVSGKAPDKPQDGKGVLLAVIDDGCPFAHAMWWHEGHYRLRAIWDQDHQPDFLQLGRMPKEFGYGAVASSSALLTHIQAHTSVGRVNEASCYNAISYYSAVRAKSHGAHTAGMLLSGASHDGKVRNSTQHDGAYLNADVVFVQLPRDVVAVPFHGARLRAMLDGIRWIIEQASTTEKNIVVALPYGSMMGPHDGSAIITSAVDALIKEAMVTSQITLKVVLSAGNDFMEHLHWQQDSLAHDASATMIVRLAPNSELPTFVEVWCPLAMEKQLLSILDPMGNVMAQSVSSRTSSVAPSMKLPICTVIRTGHGVNGELALIRFAPTAQTRAHPTAFSGDWRIRITAREAVNKPIHAYISIARGGLGSLKRSNQSHFVPFMGTGRVSSEGTLNNAATGAYTTVVGGYQKWAEEVAAKYTSSGPARGGPRGAPISIFFPQGPDLSMPSEESPLRHGFRNSGNRSASTFRMNGTSVVAPYVAARLSFFHTGAFYPQPPVPTGEKRLGTKWT